MNDLFNYLTDTWQDFIDWLYEMFSLMLDAFLWLSLQIFELLLQGFRFSFSMVEPPNFVEQGISAFTAAIPPDVGYLLGATGFDTALGLIGSAYTFRLSRKSLTLFMW
ncbi:DUF2523 domain-containing protein [Pseudoalteromonas sp. SWN29]|uniref:DUF2523 family protein n=1 Tax=Pseudoalteromonas sp. SWN29 TaxID=2792064 RepID=UPI0018CF6CA3|nr:DUF2523 family protein [Pseudoalteromonas sp. SWN29]MBH0025906.1 DUF2523 domain-containing protein [Pseudoalteromonas sp. SWN29]MBH0025914.1 DUF2523 domain-containing protein [Pseudoalteromonas sp. SWN29]